MINKFFVLDESAFYQFVTWLPYGKTISSAYLYAEEIAPGAQWKIGIYPTSPQGQILTQSDFTNSFTAEFPSVTVKERALRIGILIQGKFKIYGFEGLNSRLPGQTWGTFGSRAPATDLPDRWGGISGDISGFRPFLLFK